MRSFRLLVALATVFVLAGCGADPSLSEPAGTAMAGTGNTASAGPVGAAAASLVGGGSIDPEALSEVTPVALWFWAPG